MDGFKSLLSQASQRIGPVAANLAERGQVLAGQLDGFREGNTKRSSTSNSSEDLKERERAHQPAGTMLPGTRLAINGESVTIDRYLAEGGFAHVYVVSTDSGKKAVLKRSLCQDEAAASVVRSEIEFMKQLSGHDNIVSFYDSSVSRIGFGYEIYILMEFCTGGSLVDYLNTRLEVRLTEPEVLELFQQICRAVYHMHYGSQHSPILHRDIKIENVLLGGDGQVKLCDFGSATTRTFPAGVSIPTSEIRRLEDEVERVTTLQYRAPELCDLYMRMGISEKVDVWALGVLLYKLCYFVTPFEDKGKLAILNGRYDIPNRPQYSSDIAHLIGSLLSVDPRVRPTVYDAYAQVCSLLRVPCDLNKPALAAPPVVHSDHSSTTSAAPLPSNRVSQETLSQHTTLHQKQSALNIAPMRRGRPAREGATSGSTNNSTHSSFETLSATNSSFSDPWAVQDSQSVPVSKPLPPPSKSVLTSRTQFLSNGNANFAFQTPLPTSFPAPPPSTSVPVPRFVSNDGGFASDAESHHSDDDDDDDGTGGLTGRGKNSGADKYAAVLKGSRGGAGSDGEDETYTANHTSQPRRKSAFEGMKLFQKPLFGGGSSRGASGESLKDDDAAFAVGASGFDGFANLQDADKIDENDSSGWATEDQFSKLSVATPATTSLAAAAAAKKKPPPPPAPSKSSVPFAVRQNQVESGSFWANEQTANPQTVAPIPNATGAFWANEADFAASTVKTQHTNETVEWANEAAFETAFPATLNSSAVGQNGSNWASEDAFAVVNSTSTSPSRSSASQSGRDSHLNTNESAASPSQEPESAYASGGIAKNAFLMADRATSKKAAPAPPPPRKLSNAMLSAQSPSRSETSPIVPPSKPARRKQLPETPADSSDPFLSIAKK
ncbi:hypothetical protein HDU80_007996 [Chytriomyces hyalinus]|nr:hypothetical protein HDU80_007996 [Chytriomyces hyalinus]